LFMSNQKIPGMNPLLPMDTQTSRGSMTGQ